LPTLHSGLGWHCGPRVTEAAELRGPAELTRNLNVRRELRVVCCAPKQSRYLAETSSAMAYYENDLKSERLKLPASSFWIPSITVLLLLLGFVIALL
jgi:hypothetical protein